MDNRLAQIHRFWFGESDSDSETIRQNGQLWFGKDAQVDQEIYDRFADLIELASRQKIESDGLRPHLQLAVILLLDQFTRNIFRNDPRSFASDPLARLLAQELIGQSDEQLRPIERVFLYLPLEHSEELADQKRSVELFRDLHGSVPADVKESFAKFYDYALRHYEIIARFGRFPHRNTILGRTSTAEEIEFLSQPGSSF